MQKSNKEIVSSFKSSFASMMLLVLSVASFIVIMWVVMTIVRFFVGLTI